MGYSNIKATISPEDKLAIKASIESVKAKMPFMINLTSDVRQSLRKMGANRVSYASDLNLAANVHKTALPVSFDLTTYNSKVSEMDDLKEVYALMTSVYEGLENTLMAIGADIMTLSDTVYAHLKVEAEKSNDQNLNATLKTIAEQLKQHKKNATASTKTGS
jgi:hypothetical protein